MRLATALSRGRGVLSGLIASAVLATPLAARALATPSADDIPVRAAVAALVYGGGLLALVLGHGLVAGSVRSGVALLWLQKARSPSVFYLGRFLVLLAVTTFAISVLGLALASVTELASPGAASRLLPTLPTVLLAVFLVQGLLLACSGWGLHPDSLVTVLLLPLLLGFALGVTFRPALFGPALPVVRALAFPLDALETAGALFGGGVHALDGLAAVGRVLGYGLAWSLVGLVGVRHTTREPLPRGRGAL